MGAGLRIAEENSVSSHSQTVRQETLTVALQLAEEALAGRLLPDDKRAELVALIYDMLEEGLPNAKVLRFARAAAN